jgi:hypothetical protein
MMGAVFSMQGFGQLGGALVMLIATAGFKNSLLSATTEAQCSTMANCAVAVDKMWRILVGKHSLHVGRFHANILLRRIWSGASRYGALLPSHNSRDTKIYL